MQMGFKASSAIAMAALRQGPSHILEKISINAELINAPSLGVDDNVAYTAAQLNIAPAQAYDSSYVFKKSFDFFYTHTTTGGTLKDSLGFFGGEHRDEKDSPAHYSNMTAISDLPSGYDPGRFFILYPGIFVTLNNFVSINFCGLRMHGGTSPIAPHDANPAEFEWANRFVVISYPPVGHTDGNQRYALGSLPVDDRKHAFAALPKDHVFFIPPEMTNPS